jgi:formylglycine-generating enzyme required for sulfatase activity
MRLFISTVLVLVAVLLSGSASSDTVYEALTRQGKDYALFFAVETYDHMGDLTNPIDNAEAIAKELKNNYGFQTEVVPNPSFAQIAAKIAEYQQRFASGAFDQKGQLLIFFSGHGVQRGNNGYFLPKDGDPNKLYQGVIEYDYWRNEIDQIDCQHILVTIDACHSLTFDPNWRSKTDRTFGRRGDANKDQVLLDHQAYRARHFFTSDGTNNQTPDRSTLARQFLTGLRTYRSANNYLPADELYASYLKRAAPVPGGGDFGRDEPGSRFLFFRKVTIDPRADIAAWNKAKMADNCAGYRAYLSAFPGGDFVGVAKLKVDACEQEQRMLSAWATTKAKDSKEAYTQFLRNYPNSPYREAAELAVRTVNTDPAPGRRGTTAKTAPPDNMVFIPGGTFQMGDQFGDGSSDEKPVHAVTLSDFYLSRTELMVGEFADFVEATGYTTTAEKEGNSYVYTTKWKTKSGVTWRDDTAGKNRPNTEYNHPVIHVSWYDAVAYCNWLSGEHGLTPVYRISGTTVTPNWSANGYRLPTEAEWEYAARSGGKKEKWAGTSVESSLTQFVNYSGKGDGYERTAPVGMLRANNLGLADMSGNVYEWCWDWYGSDYYGKSPSSNPKGPDTGSSRVIRGGSWGSNPVFCRAAYRGSNGPADRSSSVGFRLARSSR